MSFDSRLYRRTLVEHLQNRLGWGETDANRVAGVALDVLRITHGAGRHYIPARTTDDEIVLSDYRAGKTIPEIASYYGLSASRVRQIIR